MPKIKMGRTTNRQKGYFTPTPTETKCLHFNERFIGWGIMNEKRAICDAPNGVGCDYRHITSDGTPICLRYWYGPQYEETDVLNPVVVQKKDNNGNLLYYENDGVTETTAVTPTKVMIPLTEQKPIPYIQNTMALNPDTGNLEPTHPEFYSKQYQDTHEKMFGVNDNKLGWFYDV